jgi:hypothetical protein
MIRKSRFLGPFRRRETIGTADASKQASTADFAAP